MDITIKESKENSLSIAGGGYNKYDDTIYYSFMGALLSIESDLSFLHTFLHEGRHKMQNDYFKSDDLLSIPPYMLINLKEDLFEGSMQYNNREFYMNNYKSLYSENDAECFAESNIYKFIQKLKSIYQAGLAEENLEYSMEIEHKTVLIEDLFFKILEKEKF